MGQSEGKDARAVEQVLYGSRSIDPGAEGCLYQPGNEPGIFNRILIPFAIDAFVARRFQNTPIDE